RPRGQPRRRCARRAGVGRGGAARQQRERGRGVKNQLRRATSRTVRSAMRGLPGPVVQRMVQVWAPLARYGGASRGGAVALSRAISVLAEPPLSLRPSGRVMSVADIAAHLARSE